MLFVPVVPYVPPSQPSPRTRELAGLLSHVIREYEAHHPAVTGTEIHAALDLAVRESRVAYAGRSRPVVGLLLGSLILLAGVAWFGLRSGSIDAEALPVGAVAIVVLVVLVGFVLSRRGPGG